MSLRQRCPRLAWVVEKLAEGAAYVLVAVGVRHAMIGLLGPPSGSPARLAYWAAASLLLGWGLRKIAERNAGPTATLGGEALRLMLLAVAAGWVFDALLTMRFAGGLDARWYGYTLIDVLGQARAGHWPVFVGQGPWQWNGSIHPIRTAPYFPNLAIALDLLTLRQLTPIAILHLTLAVSLVQAALLCYVLLVRCSPEARWLAWLAALGWILAPMALGYAVAQEMYMTVVALGWLPLVYYGNIRMMQRDDATGRICLAGGLALVWMSHAAVAVWASILTGIMQGLRLLLRDFRVQSWWNAGQAGLLFACLGGYYFWSMAELSLEKTATSAGSVIALLALLLTLAAVLRLAAGGSSRWWGAAIPCWGALWFCDRMYFNWLAGVLLAIALLSVWRQLRVRVRAPGDPAGGSAVSGTAGPREPMLVEGVVAAILIASVVALQFPFPTAPLDLARAYQAASFLLPLAPGLYQPISPQAVLLTDLQLGRVLWVAAVLGCVLAWWRGKWETRLLAAAMVCILPLMVPLPPLSTSLMLAVPGWLFGISTISLWMRLLPNFSLLAIFSVFLGLASRPPRGPGMRWLAGATLAAAGAGMVIWDVRELQKLRWRAHLSVYPPETTTAYYREDTAQLYSYSYDNLPRPGYLLDGPADYHLESRLLRASDLRLLPEPLLAAPTGEDMTLAAAPDPYSPTWLRLTPSLHLAPRERLILRFQFFPKTYNGTLVLQGPNGFYRNYYLPSAGLHDQSFGVAPGRPKTLAVWNSLDQPQEISLIFILAEPSPNFGDFAGVRLQRYRPEDLQIQTLGLTPYRARVRATEPVFLETPRVLIPGYRATVDGRSAALSASPEHLAMVRLEPGLHEVTLRFQPTGKLWLALGFSGLGWLGVGIWSAGRLRRPIRIKG